jgi:hypothetical protein
MKKSHYMLVVAALACASVLPIGPAAAQLKTQTVDYKQGDTPLEGYLAYDGNVTGKRPVFSWCIAATGCRTSPASTRI